MNGRRMRSKFLPYLLVDGAILVVLLMMVQIDWIVNGTLYDFNLVFDMEWYRLYKIAQVIILSMLAFALAAINVLGYLTYRRAVEEVLRTVFICQTCGTALTKPTGEISSQSRVPSFKVTKTCPLCDKNLLEYDSLNQRKLSTGYPQHLLDVEHHNE